MSYIVLDEDDSPVETFTELDKAKTFISDKAADGYDVSGWTVYKKVLSVAKAEITYKIEE